MRTLELYAGTQSFTKGIKRIYPNTETITIDLLQKFNPTFTIDILEWDYTIYPTGYFDIIWASPPCTEYSKAKTRGTRNLDLADSLVRKAFMIIDYFKPHAWIVENVATGLLPKRMQMIRPNIDSYIADYCVYGKPYRKRTIFWSNKTLSLSLCEGKNKCMSIKNGKHIGSVGNGRIRYNEAKINSVWTKNSIPEELINTIILQLMED